MVTTLLTFITLVVTDTTSVVYTHRGDIQVTKCVFYRTAVEDTTLGIKVVGSRIDSIKVIDEDGDVLERKQYDIHRR